MNVTDILVFNYSILVSVDTQKYSFVWYTLEHWVAHNPMLHSWHLDLFLFLCFWQNMQGTEFFTLHKPVSVV